MKIKSSFISSLCVVGFLSFLVHSITDSYADSYVYGLDPMDEVEDVALNLTDVYVPEGFDSDSNVFVIASGLFPNGCYQFKDAEIEHKTNKIHEVETYGSMTVNKYCTMSLVPFRKNVELGQFESGTHTLIFLNADGSTFERQLYIE